MLSTARKTRLKQSLRFDEAFQNDSTYDDSVEEKGVSSQLEMFALVEPVLKRDCLDDYEGQELECKQGVEHPAVAVEQIVSYREKAA